MSAPKSDTMMSIVRAFFWPQYVLAVIAFWVWILA